MEETDYRPSIPIVDDAQAHAEMPKEGSPPKILIVDDVPENLFVLQKILKKLDCEVIKASSGNEALTHILDHEFALIILDVQMPEMDGYEVADILQSDDKTGNIPIIFVTAIDRDDAKEMKGYGTGAVDFIFKPLNEFILVSKVKVFLESHKIKSGLEDIVAQRTYALSKSNQDLKDQIEKNIKFANDLEKARSYLANVINSISSSLISVDEQCNIIDLNEAAYTVCGLEKAEVQGKPLAEVFPFYGELAADVSSAITSDSPIEKNRTTIYIAGKLHINNFAIYPLKFSKIKGAVIRVDDVTERAKIDDMVIQTEKMLSIGDLATGMATEINTPLAGIIQNVQVINNRLNNKLPANERAAEESGTSFEAIQKYMENRGILRMMDAVLESGKRATQIVDNMISFSRKSEGSGEKEDLADIIDKTIELAYSDYNLTHTCDFKAIEIEKSYQEDMPHVLCQTNKMQQVVLNILKNAAQAMAEKTDYGDEKKRLVVRLETTSDNYAAITIQDNGPGMEADVAKKIFEPFFTTKKVGAGLGLAISYYIISDDHNGLLDVETEPGKGAALIIKLPLT